MSWWNSFTSSISTLGAVGKKLTGGGSFLSEEEQKREEAFTATVRDALGTVNKELDSSVGGKLAKAATKSSADLLLKGAVKFNEKIYSPLMRGVGTVGLLADSQSPLYKKGQFEEGFQFKDIKSAYERTKTVTAFQALTKSDLLPLINPISQIVLSTGKIDLNQVDLWNDENIKKNYVDNAVGRWYTGIGDFLVGNKALGVAGKVVSITGKAVAKPAGLYTKGKTVDELATDMDTGILYANSNGFEGSQTVSGSHVVLLAGTKDWGVVEDLVMKYSTNEKLIPLIREASDAEAVKDLLLADKGNLPALERLASTASHKLFDIADVKSQIKNKIIQTGELYLPEGAAVPRLQKAFDDAINSDPQFKKIKDAFFDEDYSLTPGGKTFMPIEPVVGAGIVIKGQAALRGAKTAIREREYTKMSQWFDATIGETAGGLVMRGVRLVGRGTEALPAGFVSLSGMRPLQARMELTGFLNNMKMFRDGSAKVEVSPGIYEKVSSVRARLEDEYMKTLGQDAITQVNALKSIDSQVGRMLAYKAKIYNENAINAYVARFQMNVSKGIESVKQNGFGIGYDGNVTLVQPQSLRQLAETYRFTPWDDIEVQLDIEAAKGLSKKAQVGARARRDIFAELNKVWTFDVLARPSYAFKQSLFEPIISVGLSQGISFVRKDIISQGYKRARANMYNWSANQVKIKVTNKAEYKAVVDNVTDRSQALQLAIAIKNTAEASVDELLTTASPGTKIQHLNAARKELKAAQQIVDDIELDLRDAMVPYGITEAVPSMATLERRIAYLEANPGITAKTQDVADAKAAIQNYKNTISKMATNKKVIIDADDAVQNAYAKIDTAIKELGEARIKQADVFGKSAKFKQRYYSKEKHTIVLNGTQHHIDSFVQESSEGGINNFTAAVREETKNARTQQINFLGEMAVGQTMSLLKRKIPMSKIGVDDPQYFEELADIANRQYRGDPLMDLIFSETPMDEIIRWSKTDTGSAYLKNPAFGINNPKEIPSYLAEKVTLIKRMYPSFEARAAIIKGEVTSQQLEKFLAPYSDKLYNIIPSNHNYEALTFGQSNLAKASQGYNKFMTSYMGKLASVENPIRASLFDKLATENVARKAAYLMEQGVEMTTSRYNALRQAAGREALQEMEKTLYTVNNPNRFINSLRMITAFPGANVNAFMRYGRLAAKNPVRATGVLSNYGRAYTTFGVDENGNPTDDIDKITHLVIPGTKDLGLNSRGEGIKLSAQSLGFLINRPGPSFITSLSMGQMMQKFHKSEKEVEELMTFNGTNWYKVIYPYGPSTSIRDAYTPPWLKSAVNVGPEWVRNLTELIIGKGAQKDYLSSWKSVYNYNAMLVEMGVQDDMPSDEEIEKQVKSLFRAKFFSTFASPYAGIPYKIDNAPMALTSNLYYKLQEKYKKAGLSNQDARDAAGEEMLSLLGPKFMLDRVSFVGSSKNLNMPATSEAYARVFEDNDDLVGKLANIEPGEIGLVGLLAADLSYDPAEQSNNILTLLANPKATLPGTSKNTNELKMTPQEIETERIKQRTWNQYMAVKEALEAKITDGKTLRAHPELKMVLENLATTTFKNQSQAWYDQYQLAVSGDTSYKYARALNEIVNDKKFMAKSGNSQFWKDTQSFLQSRAMFTQVYQALPDYDPRKAQLMDGYNAWVQANTGQWDGNLKTILTRYFDNDSLKAVD